MKNIYYVFVLITGINAAIGQEMNLQVEPNHSTIGFVVPISSGATRITGKFTDYELFINYVGNDLTQSKIEAVIKVNSINTGIPDRDKDLQSETFFDGKNYPEIKFESREIVADGDAFIANGTFTMRGVSKEVAIPFEKVYEEGNTLGIRARWELNRIDYGVGADFKHTSMPDFIADNILIEIDFWTRKAKSN